MLSGMKIAQMRKTIATEDITASMAFELTFELTGAPIRRPMSMQNQYAPIMVPVIAGPTSGRELK